ncbi:MAG: hypothetical protein IAE80_26825 [Anaerolinea sp.]|nr:hypothetical protein [Anaerolinea sp.]
MTVTNHPTQIDLRNLVEAHLGKPLAASAHAGLWRCPACSSQRHGLLLVSADEYKCLSGYVCDGGANEWLQNIYQEPDETLMIGVPA